MYHHLRNSLWVSLNHIWQNYISTWPWIRKGIIWGFTFWRLFFDLFQRNQSVKFLFSLMHEQFNEFLFTDISIVVLVDLLKYFFNWFLRFFCVLKKMGDFLESDCSWMVNIKILESLLEMLLIEGSFGIKSSNKELSVINMSGTVGINDSY